MTLSAGMVPRTIEMFQPSNGGILELQMSTRLVIRRNEANEAAEHRPGAERFFEKVLNAESNSICHSLSLCQFNLSNMFQS